MKLRPHHLLCLPNFVGKGYDDGFSANMAAQKRRLEAEDVFTSAEGCDEICAACPNRQGDRCLAEDKAERYDAAVRRALGLAEGQRCSYAELRRRVEEEIFSAGRLGGICGDCEWHSLCVSLIRQKKEGNQA